MVSDNSSTIIRTVGTCSLMVFGFLVSLLLDFRAKLEKDAAKYETKSGVYFNSRCKKVFILSVSTEVITGSFQYGQFRLQHIYHRLV